MGGDRIFVRDLMVPCIVGTKPEERVNKQDVCINLEIECDLAPAGVSDRIEDTLNYRTLKQEIVALVEKSEYFLIEKMADRVAALCLEHGEIRAVTVTVDKPGALTFARSVGVQIRRER
jgi:FolB domain-containing protein